jgi:hypothetical protein
MPEAVPHTHQHVADSNAGYDKGRLTTLVSRPLLVCIDFSGKKVGKNSVFSQQRA